MEFRQLSIHPVILKALAQEQYVTPTPIQTKAIPPALSGRDLLGCAQTGTGKTAAFAVPILQRLLQQPIPAVGRRPIRALILTPTRELALQIYESFLAYGRYAGLRTSVIFGGVAQGPQEQNLRRGVDILVATPGRLNDLIGQGLVNLAQVDILSLDVADRMLDMGFINDVKKILQKTPAQKQTLFFSATMPKEISDLSDSLLRDPVKVDVAPASRTVDLIAQSVYFVDKVNKRSLLMHLLRDKELQSVLVFTRTKHGADRVERELQRGGINAQAIHGDKSQASRQQALNGFKNKTIRVLVATDIAARGIDIDELSHVINFEMPDVPETYVHRIGRTGRAGHTGIAISFCDIEEKDKLRAVEKLTGRKVPVVENHLYPMQVFTPPPKVPRPPRRIEEKERARAHFARS